MKHQQSPLARLARQSTMYILIFRLQEHRLTSRISVACQTPSQLRMFQLVLMRQKSEGLRIEQGHFLRRFSAIFDHFQEEWCQSACFGPISSDQD